MWLFLTDAFLSIVAKDCDADEVLVRSRVAGDIERVFPGARVERTPHADYLFRAVVKRAELARVLAERVGSIDYGNFKGAVREHERHAAYAGVWSVMAGLQRRAAEHEGGMRWTTSR